MPAYEYQEQSRQLHVQIGRFYSRLLEDLERFFLHKQENSEGGSIGVLRIGIQECICLG